MRKKSFILVLTLGILGILAATAGQFLYRMNVAITLMGYFQDSQIAYHSGKSALIAAATLIHRQVNTQEVFRPVGKEMNIKSIYPQVGRYLKVNVSDESGKFNINTLIYPSGETNLIAMEQFRRLLHVLRIAPQIAERIADWIDPDVNERLNLSENNCANSYVVSLDELFLVKGVEERFLKVLLPYITVYGDGAVNINSASQEVLRSLSPEFSQELAQRLIQRRTLEPFKQTNEIMSIPGFDRIGYDLMGLITVKGNIYSLRTNVACNQIKKEFLTYIQVEQGAVKFLEWREL